LGAGYLDLHLGSEDGVFEVDGQVVAQVGSAVGLLASPAPGGGAEHVAESEEITQNVAEIGEDVRIEAAETASADSRVAETIVLLPLGRIAQDAVGFGRLFKEFFRASVPGIPVGMILNGQLTVSALDLLLRRASIHCQDFVIISFQRGRLPGIISMSLTENRCRARTLLIRPDRDLHLRRAQQPVSDGITFPILFDDFVLAEIPADLPDDGLVQIGIELGAHTGNLFDVVPPQNGSQLAKEQLVAFGEGVRSCRGSLGLHAFQALLAGVENRQQFGDNLGLGGRPGLPAIPLHSLSVVLEFGLLPEQQVVVLVALASNRLRGVGIAAGRCVVAPEILL
jgi:hypothetical protein